MRGTRARACMPSRAAGVTRPARSAEFGDRDELFAALLAREEERVLAMAAAATPHRKPGSSFSMTMHFPCSRDLLRSISSVRVLM
ncbi:hypothetical protein [Nocardia sp. NPDC051463]|uniref:hypothetical protein n=1 Tax=Nocardia sp. NPDC051463 TaxID=3154845 RepID=UPI0034503552